MKKLEIYNKVKVVPNEAKKAIKAGRLKGMTDINPMWRIKCLTETFGLVGFGWYYEITKQELVEGSEGQKVAFVNINLFVKHNDEWSKPIQGTGGSSFIAKESRGPYTSDECFKMALTDAISVACKAIGIGADVYWEKGTSKYTNNNNNNNNNNNSTSNDKQSDNKNKAINYKNAKCSTCGSNTPENVAKYSDEKFGKVLCFKCQKGAK